MICAASETNTLRTTTRSWSYLTDSGSSYITATVEWTFHLNTVVASLNLADSIPAFQDSRSNDGQQRANLVLLIVDPPPDTLRISTGSHDLGQYGTPLFLAIYSSHDCRKISAYLQREQAAIAAGNSIRISWPMMSRSMEQQGVLVGLAFAPCLHRRQLRQSSSPSSVRDHHMLKLRDPDGLQTKASDMELSLVRRKARVACAKLTGM